MIVRFGWCWSLLQDFIMFLTGKCFIAVGCYHNENWTCYRKYHAKWKFNSHYCINLSICFFVCKVDVPYDLHGAWNIMTWLTIYMMQKAEVKWPGPNHHHHQHIMSTYIETPFTCILCKSDSNCLVTNTGVNKVTGNIAQRETSGRPWRGCLKAPADFPFSLSKLELEKVRHNSDCRN